MRRACVVLLAALAVACAAPDADERAGERRPAERAEVPGVETALVATAEVRDVVRAFGQVTAEAESPALRDARAALAEAEARRTLAEQQVRRLAMLAGDAVAPRKELEAARAEEKSAEAAAARTRQSLAAFGGARDGAPIASDETWVMAQVLQLDVALVDAGAEASFSPDAFPDATLAGRVDAAPAYVDASTGSAPVRLRVHDPTGRLRPGMTGAAAIEVGALRAAIVVPSAAVVYDAARPLVFVQQGDRYVAQAVGLGVTRDGRTEIAQGLAAGARVVVTGAASLLSEARLPAGGE